MAIDAEYVKSLPEIYREILAAVPRFDPTRKAGYGLSFPSLYSALNGKYNLAEIRLACERMAEGGVLEIKNEIFAHPTPLGEELIAAVTHGRVALPGVPAFVSPPSFRPSGEPAG
jgi:hypothetical protein